MDQLQLPIGIAVGVIALVIAIGLAKFSSTNKEKDEMKVQFVASTPATPVKSASVTESGTPIAQKTGTVFTPAGRRSARLARRKED
eukprot:jgi/Psemu1/311610/fgenesh1_kg.797_\